MAPGQKMAPEPKKNGHWAKQMATRQKTATGQKKRRLEKTATGQKETATGQKKTATGQKTDRRFIFFCNVTCLTSAEEELATCRKAEIKRNHHFQSTACV